MHQALDKMWKTTEDSDIIKISLVWRCKPGIPALRMRQEEYKSLGYGEWKKQAPRGSWASSWAAWLSLPGILLEAPSLRPPLALSSLKDQHMPRASRVCI